MQRDLVINCGSFDPKRPTTDVLPFQVDGKSHAVNLLISRLRRRFVSELPDILSDLIEIAAYVYGADAAVSRGGAAGSQMGKQWRRRFVLRIPVRCMEIWCRKDIREILIETLCFLSDDHYSFDFHKHDGSMAVDPFFEYGLDDSWKPNSVIMFSGGLDFFAGALEAALERKEQVALVSHHGIVTLTRRSVQRRVIAVE